MNQNQRVFGRRERMTQHAIEIFDLVDITPAATAGKVVNRRFLQSSLATVRYDRAKNVTTHIVGNL